jgi:small subunit ribosomal protein S27e
MVCHEREEREWRIEQVGVSHGGIGRSLLPYSGNRFCALDSDHRPFSRDNYDRETVVVIEHVIGTSPSNLNQQRSRLTLFYPHIHSQTLEITSLATMPVDLLNPSPEHELRTHKLKRLVQSPNSFFMDIKCPGCFQITTVFSHAQTVVMCGNCNIHLCEPTGGKARLTEGCSYRRKVD